MFPITLKTAGTVAVTGGTSVVYSTVRNLPDGVEAAVLADTDFRLRRTLVGKVKEPKPSVGAPGGYTQARASVLWRFPKLLANGKYTVSTVLVSAAFEPEMTAAERQEALDFAAQGAAIALPELFKSHQTI